MKKKTKAPKLTKGDLSTLHHALDICDSDYSSDEKYQKEQVKQNNKVRNKLFDIANYKAAK